MAKRKVVVIGAGRAGEELAVAGIKDGGKHTDLSGAHLAAIADVDEARAKAVAAKWGIPSAYGSLSAMLDKEKPDVAIITTPLRFHHPNAMECIERKVNFVMEKPATETLAQLEEVRRAAERSGVKGMVSHNYKFLDGFQQAWKWYEQGVLGDILHVDRVWMTPAKEDRMERADGWYHHIPGGRMADGLPHHVYIPFPFVGEMELVHVSVKKNAKDRPWSACDEADIMLSTRKGYVNIRMGTNQEMWPEGKRGNTYYAVLYGTRRNAFVYHNDAVLLSPGLKSAFKHSLAMAKESLIRRVSGVAGKPREMGVRGGHNVMYSRFLKYLDGGIPNPVPWEEAIGVMRTVDEVSTAMQASIDAWKKPAEDRGALVGA